jgi:uncharacterized protein HemY
MASTWMEAAGQNGIPAAFLVGKDGKIAWIGHPMGLQVETVESVLAGSYDVAKAAEEYKKQKSSEGRMQELGKKYNAAMQAKDWVEAETTLNEIAKYLPNGQEGVMGARIQIQVGKGDLDAAAMLAQQMADKSPHPGQLNSIAWLLLTQDNIKGKALDIAYALAVKANTAAEGKDPAILDTVARAAFLKGDKA